MDKAASFWCKNLNIAKVVTVDLKMLDQRFFYAMGNTPANVQK